MVRTENTVRYGFPKRPELRRLLKNKVTGIDKNYVAKDRAYKGLK